MKQISGKESVNLLEKQVSRLVYTELLSNLFSICTPYSVLQAQPTASQDPSIPGNTSRDELAFVNLKCHNNFRSAVLGSFYSLATLTTLPVYYVKWYDMIAEFFTCTEKLTGSSLIYCMKPKTIRKRIKSRNPFVLKIWSGSQSVEAVLVEEGSLW